MHVHEGSQLFLLLAWLITIAAGLGSVWLGTEVRKAEPIIKHEAPAPYVIPLQSTAPRSNSFVPPPPPF